MSKKLPDWSTYWRRYNDLATLQKKSNDLDETLQGLETEFECKLLSGDHIQIITALEERIEELEKIKQDSANSPYGVQASLFEEEA